MDNEFAAEHIGQQRVDLEYSMLHPRLRGEFIERHAVHLKPMRMEIHGRIIGADGIRIERGVGQQ